MKLKKKFTVFAILVSSLLLYLFFSYAISSYPVPKSKGTPQDRYVTINKINFIIPSNINATHHTDDNSIQFIIDAETLHLLRIGDQIPKTRQKIDVIISETYGFPSRLVMPSEQDKLSNCEYRTENGVEYEMCQYDRDTKSVSYFIREKRKAQPTHLLRCHDLQHSGLPNPRCLGEAVMFGNVFIRTTYSSGQLHQAFEINQKIQEIANNFISLARNKENAVHTDPK